ncbi:hypothetical protein K3M67_19495 (plasmid) [Sphingobium sp. V4]|uniref:hypothetical protein n=1 Tax=Sphingobium sp. V4 TaxID=3038927 RepID=UPI002557D778|nr:hypothetical protein [Sphingobium sp. V4]WIW90236.1 hypothetical protein K3M67_19495 [Sphingobium sp. V4]
MAVTGWKVDADDRHRLLARFAPRWPDVIADHVTLDAKANSRTPLPSSVSAEIVGEADDDAGLQAMVVAIDGSTDRSDGGTYHITWSLDRSRGRKPVQSNDVIKARGWRPLERPVPVALIPARFG